MRSICLLVLVFAVSLPMTPQTKTSPSSKSSAKSSRTTAAPPTQFALMAAQFMRESLALSPVSASQAGYHVHGKGKAARHLDAELDDLSPTGFEKQAKFYRRWHERFRTTGQSLGMEDAADLQLINDNIALNLLELERIHNYRHNPTVYVELIGNGLFLPLTQEYASKQARIGHVLSRMSQIPRALGQAKQVLADADPIFVKVALEENEGNVDLIENAVKSEIPGSALTKRYQQVAPKAVAALRDFSRWLQQDFGKRKPSRTWRIGKELYDEKFKYVMESSLTPEQLLADAERDMQNVRAEMLEIATPMHREMYPDHDDHGKLGSEERANTIISEVLKKISDDHPKRDELIEAVKSDLDSIKQFIREKKIVALSARENLKVIPTPPFMRGIYSVAGFHSAPPLEPHAEAEYWVTPIDPKTPDEKAESKLREYNNWVLKWLTIHEALPGHYIQFEHANDVQPESRRLLRAFLGNGAYVEGWAEYIAQVMMDEGFANNDPRFRLSMRKIRLRLLANTILDIRMQTMNMTDEDALHLMTRTAFQTQAEAEGKLQRAKLSSTQLPTYYVGLREWLKLRKKYQESKGDGFNMLQFHNLVLDQGPIAFESLDKIVMQGAGAAAGAE